VAESHSTASIVSVGEGLAEDSVGAGAADELGAGAAEELGEGAGVVEEQAASRAAAMTAATRATGLFTPRPYVESSEKTVSDGARDQVDTPFPASSQSSPWCAQTASLTLET